MFYFREYANVNIIPSEQTSCSDDELEDEDIKVKTGLSQQRLLFVHQTEWQRRLLSMYGNEICLLDATHKTTRYALPLFFVAIRTNVDYQVVASFVSQDESTESIKEALRIVKSWNKEWSPDYFMTDY